MKLAVPSESETDEAIVRILVDAILARPTEAVDPKSLRRRAGFSPISAVLPGILLELHFNSDADGLAVVFDSNSDPVREPEHEASTGRAPNCRLCRLRKRVGEILDSLPSVPGRATLRIAVGQASPAIEAWLLCDQRQNCSESALKPILGKPPRVMELKRELKAYFPSGRQGHEPRLEAARRAAGDLELLRKDFPGGFGSFERQVRSWLEGEERAS